MRPSVHTNNTMQNEEICAAANNTLHGSVLASIQDESAIAIIDGSSGKTHSYRSLARDVRLLAQAIWQAVVPRQALASSHTGKLIAVLCEKSYQQALATLAIMQAAHAYLPLHVEWPAKRILEVLAEGGVEYVLISRACARNAELCATLGQHYRLLIIEDLLESQLSVPDSAAISMPEVTPDDIAYVIFTSGSTGKPKGVTISHRGALNTIHAVNRRYAVGAKDKVLALSELSFDLSVYDIFGLLMVGGTVVFPDQARTKEGAHWLDLVKQHQITLWNTVPQLASLLADECRLQDCTLTSLRLFLLSGDKIPLSLPEQLMQVCPAATVVSLGGATEGSIWSIWYQIDAVASDWRSIPYGYAMPNQHMLVLDDAGQLCAPGVAGEIHIGGMGVALNYWGDAAKTAASFIQHPQWGRLYRTGDLGALHAEQYIEFIGRKDRQLKIRGYRVELGEIEAQLATCQGIKDSAVIDLHSLQAQHSVALNGARQQLLAYYVTDEQNLSNSTLPAQLRSQLQAVLPDYMVPEQYIELATMPLTANGKLDYKALPLPAATPLRACVAPQSALEQEVATIWGQILGLADDAVSMNDEFVALGGDSIDAIRLASRLRQNLHCQISVADIFEGKTIQALCAIILAKGGKDSANTASKAEQGQLQGEARLLPVQQWFFQQQFAHASQWSQAFFIHTPSLDTERLQACLNQLFSQHDAFRLRFTQSAQAITQHYQSSEIALAPQINIYHDGASRDHAQYLRQVQQQFDLENGPLCSVDYISGYADGSARICFLVHHLLVDTVSWRILAEDLEQLYQGQKVGQKGSSYRQWADAVHAYAAANLAQRDYWQAQLQACQPVSELLQTRQAQVARSEFNLNQADTAHLLQAANQVHHTEINDLLLAALARVLRQRFASDCNGIMLEGHGREEIDANTDISRTMGWFTSLFPVALRASGDMADTIRTVKESLRAIPDKGVGFGSLLGYAHSNLPVICFNYLGQLAKQPAGNSEEAEAQAWHLSNESIVLLSDEGNHDDYRLVITAAVLKGQMQFTIESYLGAALANDIAQQLQQSLQEVIAYTTAQQRSFLTPHDVGHILTQSQLDQLQASQEVEQVFLANSLQQGFIYHALSQGETDTAYQVQTIWEYHSAIEEAQLQQAWRTAQQMYGALRMRFAWQEKMLQIIDNAAPLHWQSIDLSAMSETEQQQHIQQLLEDDRKQRFALDQAGLFRLYFIRQGERDGVQKSALLFSCHHAILDGWSSLVLINKTHDIYLQLIEGKAAHWQPERAYQDAQRYVQQHSQAHADYWREALQDAPVQNRLSALIKPEQQQDLKTVKYVAEPAIVHHWYRGASLQGLRELCLSQGVTVNALFEFLCHQILHFYSYEEQTITGATVSGRDLPLNGMEDAVGMLINTLPLVTRHSAIAELPVADALRQLQQQITSINSKSPTALASLQKEGRRIFDLLFVHNNFASLDVEHHRHALGIAQMRTIEKLDYPLAMIIEEGSNEIQVTIRYAGELFEANLITSFFDVMDQLLAQILAAPHAPVRALAYHQETTEEAATFDGKIDGNIDGNIVSRFEQCVTLYPERIALQHGTHSISYAQLNQRANALAVYLQARFAPQAEAMIPVCFADPVLDIVASLALLKLGAAYVPLAAKHSPAQASFTIQDTAAPFMLTENALASQFTGYFPQAAAVVALDSMELPAVDDNLAQPITSNQLCCVMYTSGSTGQAKGVQIEHAGVVSLVQDAGYISLSKEDVLIHLADRRFDASLFEVWGALLNGGKLVLVSDTLELLSDVNQLATLLQQQAVSVLWLTKSLFDELYRQSETLFQSLTWLLVGGEALNRPLIEKLLASHSAPKHLLNGYGPTENTTFSAVCELTLEKLRCARSVPIGQPLKQRQARVLGRARQSLPVGAIGELYVGGAGLARGYLHQAALTAQVFIEHQGQRWYKTGDLAQLAANGELVFMGRADNQVKLRGYRIELEELELAIAAFPGIAQAAAAIKTNANAAGEHKQLVGYYLPQMVGDQAASIDLAALREHLAHSCADFMQPAQLIALQSMPLTSSGKVNREALPEPASVNPVDKIANTSTNTTATTGTTTSALTEMQAGIRKVWASVLGLAEENIGLDDDFFAIGGDSILCMQMVGALNKQYRKNLVARLVFKHKTLAALANFLDNAAPEGYIKIRKIWAEVLGREAASIGFQDDFFSIGGDSILCLQMVNRFNKELKQKLVARIVFKNKTIAALHAWMEQRAQADSAPATPAATSTSAPSTQHTSALAPALPMLPIQQWFFALQVAQPQHWNQSFLIHTPALDAARLQAALQKLFAAHAMLGMRYRQTANGAEQFASDANASANIAVPAINVAGLSSEQLQQQLTALQSQFHLENGPLASVAYLHGYADGSARIFMAFHHLLMDAVSWRILASDLEMLYAGESLAAPSSSFDAWVKAVQHYASQHNSEKSYWQNLLADYDATPYQAMVAQKAAGKQSFRLSLDTTSALLHKSQQAFNTSINDLLVAALALALRDWSGRSTHHIVLEGHGREHIDDAIDLSRTVGWFTILCPLRISAAATLAETITSTKDNLRAVPNKGLGYGALFGYQPAALPKISFNYLGQFHEGKSANWYLADEAAGSYFHPENRNHNLLDINCYVKAGQLLVEIDGQLGSSSAIGFATHFAQRINEVVELCQARQVTEFSASDFLAIESAADLDQLPAIPSGDPHDWFEMTEIQKAYLLGRLASFEIGNIANHIYYEYVFDQLDAPRLEQALNTLIAREPVLRTQFSFERMQQRIVPLADFGHYAVARHHLADGNEADGLAAVRERLSHMVYNPEQAPLFSFEVSHLASRAYLHISMDLILLDAESRRRLLAKLDHLYRQPDLALEKPVTSFKHYQAAYQALRLSPWYQRDRAYWQEKVLEMPLRPELPLQVAPNAVASPIFADHTLYIAPDVWQKFKAQAARYEVSPSAALLSLYGEVIAFHAGSPEFIMTMTVFNRYPMFDDVEHIMGDFTSTNLFHFKSSGADVLQTIQRSHSVMWDNIAHSLYTGLEVQRDLVKLHQLDMHKATSPIVFTGVLGNKNAALENRSFLHDGEYQAERLWMGQTSQAWIDLQAIEVSDRFMSKWLYVEQLFAPGYIASLNQAYCSMIEYLANHDWNASAAALPTISPRQQALLAQLNNQALALPEPDALNQPIFALLQPSQAPAVIADDGQITSYQQLLEQSSDLARHLWHKTGQQQASLQHTGKLIAVLCEKGAAQLSACLAIMQAGHGYLPLNVEWPTPRLLAVLREGQVTTLVISAALAANAELVAALSAQCQLVVIDEVLAHLQVASEERDALRALPLPSVQASDIAYVIFTSGSTGTPKGVTISHQGALNTILAVNQRFNVGPSDKVLALSELSFDLSVYDMFGLLIAGGTVVFPPQALAKDMATWLNLIEQHQITMWNTVPQLAALLAEEYRLQRRCNASLRLFLLSGDRIPLPLSGQLRERFGKAQIMSLGGATEGSIWSIWYDISEPNPSWASVPYGSAMPAQSMYILNPQGQLCPFGVTGEIYIGGAGVALNYWGDSAKTAASFIQHATLGRIYKTGDLGRWLADGNIEFIGRKDGQVKIRGYRVELGEIEACLAQVTGVEEAVLSLGAEHPSQPHTQAQLTAYIKPAQKLRATDSKLEFKLAQHGDRHLPDSDLTRIAIAQPSSALADWKQVTRKSYRQFHGTLLQKQQLLAALAVQQQAYAAPKRLDVGILSASLHGLLALSDADAPLPKYRYPSAGTLYPVQVYLQVHSTEIGGVARGSYYLDRRHHQLVRLGDAPVQADAPALELLLVSTPAAIEPLYGAASEFLSLLECGYIEGVLNAEQDSATLHWQRAALEFGSESGLQLADGQRVISRLIPSEAALRPATPHCVLYVRPQQVQDLDGGWYRWDEEGLRPQAQWPALPDPQALDDNAIVFNSAALAVFWLSAEEQVTGEEYIQAGAQAQLLMEQMLAVGLGSCAIGEVHPEQRAFMRNTFGNVSVLHHFVAGPVSAAQLHGMSSSSTDRAGYFARHVEQQLSKRLPHYMVPERLVLLDHFPLSANGKLDRAALLAQNAADGMGLGSASTGGTRTEPSSEVEIALAKLWSEMLNLGTHQIAVEDHFFRLGGNSLLAMQFISRLKQEFDYKLKLDELYQYSDLKSISSRVEAANAESVNRLSGEL